MIENFDEGRPEFKGFSKYYHDVILDGLLGLDMQRRETVKLFLMWVVIGMIIGGAGFAVSLLFGLFGVGVFLGFAGFAFGMSQAEKRMKIVRVKTKNHLVGSICNYVNMTFNPEGFTPMDLKIFRALKLLPRADRENFEDQITGAAHGANFKLHEAHLEQRNNSDSGSNYSTVFRGILMTLDFPMTFTGTTLVLRQNKIFNFKRKGNLKRVGLADPVFEKAFEAFGSDQVEARYLLTPTFMQRLLDLESIFSGKNLKAAFQNGQLMIVIEAGNQFEVGSMFQTLTDRKRTEKLITEIGLVFDIVDTVLKPAANRVSYKSNVPTKGT